MKDIADYGSCYIVSIVCPADGVDLPRKTTLFEVCDGVTDETLDTFRTARQAKKFAHRYIANSEGTMQQRRQLSADRIIHTRVFWAVSLLSMYSEYDIAVVDKHNPQATPKRYYAITVFVVNTENRIAVLYYPDDEATSAEYLYIDKVKSVRAISKSSFSFESYSGKTYTITGID